MLSCPECGPAVEAVASEGVQGISRANGFMESYAAGQPLLVPGSKHEYHDDRMRPLPWLPQRNDGVAPLKRRIPGTSLSSPCADDLLSCGRLTHVTRQGSRMSRACQAGSRQLAGLAIHQCRLRALSVETSDANCASLNLPFFPLVPPLCSSGLPPPAAHRSHRPPDSAPRCPPRPHLGPPAHA